MRRGISYILVLLGMFVAGQASAADFSFTGNLANDDDIAFFDFTVGTPSTITLRSWSYAGGTNSDGTVIPAGGFDPILALFDSAGNLIAQNDDGAGVPVDPVSGNAYDTLLQTSVPPGNYTVSVAQYSNFANGPTLADGFSGSGQTNFGGRTSFWAFDILNVDAAVGPPPVGSGAGHPVPTLSEWAMILLVTLVGLIGARAGTRRQKTVS